MPKKTMSVVYTTDSIGSIMAAAMIKRKAQLSTEYYDFVFTEIADLQSFNMTDVYLWLGLPVILDAAIAQDRLEFQKKLHRSITDKTIHDSISSAILEEILEEKRELIFPEGIEVATFYENELRDKVPNGASTILYGIILSGLLNWLHLVGGDINESDVYEAHTAQVMTHEFYRKQTSMDSILWIYSRVMSDLKFLRGADEVTDTPTVSDYLRHYKSVAAALGKKVNVGDVRLSENVHKNKAPLSQFHYKSVEVLYSIIDQDFWMARRIITFSHPFFHNTRLAHHGKHHCTNLIDTRNAMIPG